MKFSVLINNYNYASYLRECIDSVLAQTLRPYEIIVVDDGSTDNSLAVLQDAYGNNPLVKVIQQRNGGQIYAVDIGIREATGDVCCLLDADDYYHPGYLASLTELYKKETKADLVFCRFTAMGDELENPVWLSPSTDYDYGQTALLTYYTAKTYGVSWIGNINSCISLRTKLAKILRLGELARLWNYPMQTDYAVLLGTSLLGGRKYYLAKELVFYRIHDKNHWASDERFTATRRYMERMRNNVAIKFYADWIDKLTPRDIDMELATIPQPMEKHVEHYQKIKRKLILGGGFVQVSGSFLRKLEQNFRKFQRNRAS